MDLDLKKYEKELYAKGHNFIAGTDEAGRGPLAGPVVAAAIILPKDYTLAGLTDSKKLTEKKRNLYFDILKKDALCYSVCVIDAQEIDEINIYEASRLAMNTAIDDLSIKPDYILADAMPLKRDNSKGIIKGDAKSLTIAAASVLAKVTRDRLMQEYDEVYPEFGFAKHKGYGTKMHKEAMEKYGVTNIHRVTYAPVREQINKNNIYKKERN